MVISVKSATFAVEVLIHKEMKDVWVLQSDSFNGLLKAISLEFIPEVKEPHVLINTTESIDEAIQFDSVGEAMKFISEYVQMAKLYRLSTALKQILSFKVMMITQ